MRNKTKKIFIKIVLGVYLITTFLQSGIYRENAVYAASTGNNESQTDNTNLVAIIVDDKIYSKIESYVKWYATEYIQGKSSKRYNSISNSKALVFPINVDNFSAKNITQLLENMYFDGIQGATSKLVGLVLIGDVPLPVVNQDGYIYPTIYPYVDFEDQKFIWDEESKYFVYNNNPNGQAEIWHGMINFGENIGDYEDYFNKLKRYWVDPSHYIGKAIWYEDFIGNNKYFNDNSLNLYLNNFIFAEDLGYHRYSDLMVKVLQGQRNEEMANLVQSLNSVNSSGVVTSGMNMLSELNDSMNTPTMQIKSMIDKGYLAGYSSLFGQKYLKTITNNVETANRWIESRTGSEGEQYYLNAFDSVYKKAEITDEVLLRTQGGLEPFMIMLNNALEEAVDKKVEEEKYRLNEVIPLTYLEYRGEERSILGLAKRCFWGIYDAYENYFFGDNAQYIDSMEEASIYRGTYRNYVGIDGVTVNDIQNSQNPSTDISTLDLNKKSIGGSYEIFAQQIEANRGYNYSNSVEENEIFSGNKISRQEFWDVLCTSSFLGICIRRKRTASDEDGEGCDLSSEDGDQGGCENPMDYSLRIWGGASPLNLDVDGSNFVWKSGYSYTGATSKIFDIAGSTALPYSLQGGEYESNSFESVNKYSSLILRKFSPQTHATRLKSGNPRKKRPAPTGYGYDKSVDYDVKFTNQIPQFDDDNHVIGWKNKNIKTANSVDYFANYVPTAHVEGQIIKMQKPSGGGDASCRGAGEIYTYRTLDSRVKNDSVNESELNSNSYRIFTDNSSPVKQFYDELSELVHLTSDMVNNEIGSDSGSLVAILGDIKDTIDNINSGLNGIINLSGGEIEEIYNTGAIEDLAATWLSVFDADTVQTLSGKIKEAQDGVTDLSGLVEMGGSLFSDVVEYVRNEAVRFNSNGWQFIFLNRWKQQLYHEIYNTFDKYSQLKQTIIDIKTTYDSIDDISTNYVIINNLSGKLYDIDRIPSGGSGCNNEYSGLCAAISEIINNHNTYASLINSEKDNINSGDILKILVRHSLFQNINGGRMARIISGSSIGLIPGTGNEDLLGYREGMNMTTADRPIDSPRYLTFKGIGGDKVTFIYPDIYKAEIFSGNSNVLTLKSTGDIKKAIEKYLKDVVKTYNKYLLTQKNQHNTYYNANKQAFQTLNTLDPLANPNHLGDSVRPYGLFDENYLIDRLKDTIRHSYNSGSYFAGEELANNDPIGFIAEMIYYQNVAWQTKSISGTIQGDFDNQRMDFDINEKISYLMDNYLVKDNDKGSYLTPQYRPDGYEVAFINSDGNDRIIYENTPDMVNSVSSASMNYSSPSVTNVEALPLEEELLTECNIPMDEGVLLFQMSGGGVDSPWRDAIECWWKQIKEKPFEFKMTLPFKWDRGSSTLDNLGDLFSRDNYQNIGETYQYYANQWKLLDTDNMNESILADLESSNPADMAKLQQILSYTVITPQPSVISADTPEGEIKIDSSKQLGDIEFKVINIGSSKVKLLDGTNIISNNITVGTGGFSTGTFTFDPYDHKTLTFEFINPKEGLNVVFFYLCLPGTQYCANNSFRLDVVPGEVKNVKIELDRHIVLEGASVPFKVKGTDKFGNAIGELISQKFDISVSSGLLVLKGAKSQSMKISNFNKTNFSLLATGGNLDGKTISIQVSGIIDLLPGVKATESVNVVKGRLDTYSGNMKLASGSDIITGFEIQLPDNNIYFVNNQPNTATLPKLNFKLVDKNGNLINIDGKFSVRTKNNRLSPGDVVLKNGGSGTQEYKFSKANTFDLSGGNGVVYLLPNFSAGEEVIYISMEGVDNIELPVVIRHASPKVLGLSADKTILDPNSSTDANLKLFDSWGNIIDDNENIFVVLESANNKISLSKSGNIRILSGSLDFKINSTDKGGLGYLYAYIHTGIVPMDKQNPDTLQIIIQEKMLPEEDLNVMYLNLFGNDWGNQWGYMSDNEKYSESLIKNSDKLLTVTTQLLDLKNIKYYPIVIDSGLQINNTIGSKIIFNLYSGFVFDIDKVGKISIKSNSFNLVEAKISEDALEQYITSMVNGTYKNKNVLFYIPEQTDSIIESNEILDKAIHINGHKVFDIKSKVFDKNLTISLLSDKIAGYQVWEVLFDTSFVGRMIFVVNKKSEISMNLSPTSLEYSVGNTWINGSSNEYGIGFYKSESTLSTRTFGYKSIQDSYNSTLGIGFTSDFKNITNFGGGMSVGEATLPFGSELLINIGDPLLKRIDTNESAKIYDESGSVVKDTEFDLGLGKVIYSDPDKEIFKVLDIDFNNDKLKDLVIVYNDGTVKILKNYGGTDPFQDLGALMTLAERITDISAGDVDGNGYEDILVWTQAGGLRVYLNHKGVFDVDGYPVCINVNVNKGEISENPEKMSGIHQIFLKDMDLDGALDIVTNDRFGFIKIFYGGTTSGNINYLSNNKYMCDDGWYDRVKNNSKIVYQFGVKIGTMKDIANGLNNNPVHIVDQSLIRWKGISNIGTGNELKPEDLGIDGNMVEGLSGRDDISAELLQGMLSNVANFDMSAAEDAYMQSERFRKAGFGVIPVYEPGIENEGDLDYVEIGCLTGSDPVKIYKTYEDMNNNPIESNLVDIDGALTKGDMVRVTVYIEANENFIGTFIDRISGPRIIPLSEYDEDMFEYFWFDDRYIGSGYITTGQIVNMANNIYMDLSNARYMIDNIVMKKGDKLKFSYGLIYDDYNVFDIDIDTLTGNNFSGLVYPNTEIKNLPNFSNDVYPDISIQPSDGCNDSMFVFFNNGSGSRDYTMEFMDLGKVVADYMNQDSGSLMDNTTQTLSNSVGGGDSQQVFNTISELAGGLRETIDWGGMLSLEGINISNAADAGRVFVDALTSNMVNKIDDAIGSACNGFSVDVGGGGSCRGLPLPFNWALLGVGDYKVFGCYDIPVLSRTIGKGIPILDIPTTVITPVGPIPFVGFFGLPTKVAETDTYFLGAPTGTYPSLFRLYVMPTLTMKLGFALCFGPQVVGDNIPDPFASIAGNCIVFAVDPCQKKSGEGTEGPNSTTELPYEYTFLKGCTKQNVPCYLGSNESSSPFIFGGSSTNVNKFSPIIPGGSYAGGFINIEVSPATAVQYKEESPLDIDAITLEGGATTKNAIRGSTEQGLIQKIVKQRLDKQIKYIMTNLTNFKISVIWPDLESFLGKAPAPEAPKDKDQQKDDCENKKGQWIDGVDATKKCNGKAYCCLSTEASDKLECENRGKQRDSTNKKCVNKISQNFEDEALASIDSRTQKHLWSKEEISSLGNFDNPFRALEDDFSKTPLINISTQDIKVNVPMITSEDITAYISMSQSWVNRQQEILEDWQYFIESVIGICGGSTNINGIDDLGSAVNQLKEQYKDANNFSQGSTGDNQLLQNLQGKIDALEKLKKNYNLSDLGSYNIFEAKDGGFYVYVKYSDLNFITPQDVYLYFDPGTLELSMFTSGFNLKIENVSNNSNIGRSKISIEKDENNPDISNEGLAIKEDSESIYHSCADMFLDGTIDGALKGFLNIHSKADSLMFAVRENIKTLEQYKLFPLQLYDWIHVEEKYLGEVSNLVDSVLGTLSIWLETNANRFSQYVDAIISIMTTLETYQLIIDLSADWTENCSTCTNDNYNQFSCKLGKICDWLGIELPIIEIPSTKIPSIYLDFSEIHVSMDVVIPNFEFDTVSVPLPELPNLPSPPNIDFSLNLDGSLGAGIDFIMQQIKGVDFNKFSSINLGNIPLLPSPPTLPELPSLMPEIQMELPLLPPAPKIPQLPNKITAAVESAKIIGKILCIVKGKFGLVAESAIKAKVEEITERDYEIPFRDNLDLTSSDWNLPTSPKMSSSLARIFTGFSALLQSDLFQTNEFKNVKMKGFDISLQTYINLQFDFDDLYAFLQSVVDQINKVSYTMSDFVNDGFNEFSSMSKEFTDILQACTNNPISVECNPDAAELINEYKQIQQDIIKNKNLLENLLATMSGVLAQIETKTDKIEDFYGKIDGLLVESGSYNKLLNEYNDKLAVTYNETEKSMLLDNIRSVTKKLDSIKEDISNYKEKTFKLEQEVAALNEEYSSILQQYETLKDVYEALASRLGFLKNLLMQKSSEIIDQINNTIQEAGENINFENLGDLNRKINSGQAENDDKKQKDKQMRFENLQNLYKEMEGVVSYVDYDKDVNENNFKILKNTLSEISKQTNNKDIKNRAQEYLGFIDMDKKVNANVDSIDKVQREYEAIVDEYLYHNNEIVDLIENDYDKFLVAVSDKKTALVNSNRSLDVTLSANLFDMNKNTVKALSNQESIAKMYMDYNVNNLKGYLDAFENYDAQALNMTDYEYNLSKSYLNNIKVLSDKVYDIMDDKGEIDNKKINNLNLLAQSAGGGNGSSNGGTTNSASSSTIDIANYIEGYSLNTKEGSFKLANTDYIKNFQSRFLFTDINGDVSSDLILWDNHNIYIKYRDDNSIYVNSEYYITHNHSQKYYNTYYSYELKSYDKLLLDAKNGFIKIGDMWVKLVDTNREVKNFKYVGQTFDTIKVSWSNSSVVGDDVDGYLVKMIHRVDQFNDNENLNQGNNIELFDKKYVLVLPKGSEVTGTKLKLEKETLSNTERWIGTGNKIFSLLYYNDGDDTINLTVSDLPRNWQYSEIYSLTFDDNTYKISSSASNQVVAGPQIIADTEGPDPDIKLYRPAADKVVSDGTSLEGYVGTNYILQVDWIDNVAMDEMWILDEYGETLAVEKKINNQTGHIELSGLYFTGEQSLKYYMLGVDIDGNSYSTDVNLLIKTPSIEITKILQGNQNLTYANGIVGFSPRTIGVYIPTISNKDSVVTVVAELEHDIDSGFVQFFNNRGGNKLELLEGTVGSQGFSISSFKVQAGMDTVYGGNFSMGDDIGLYSVNGDMVATVNPKNGKITIVPGYQNTIKIKLDYSAKIPVIKVMEGDKIIFWIIYTGEELVNITTNSNHLSVQAMDNEGLGDFNGGKAIVRNGEVLLYVSPKGQIYTESTLYGEYSFDESTESVVYSFRTLPVGANLGSVKIKIKNLLE